MVSSNLSRNRKEKVLHAHKVLLRLDDIKFNGSIKFHFNPETGLISWTLEEHGNFQINSTSYIGIEEIKKII